MTRRRSRFDVGWQDWAVALAIGAIVLLLGALALATLGGWSHQRDVARAMQPPPPPEAEPLGPRTAPAPRHGGGEAGAGRAPAATPGGDR